MNDYITKQELAAILRRVVEVRPNGRVPQSGERMLLLADELDPPQERTCDNCGRADGVQCRNPTECLGDTHSQWKPQTSSNRIDPSVVNEFVDDTKYGPEAHEHSADDPNAAFYRDGYGPPKPATAPPGVGNVTVEHEPKADPFNGRGTGGCVGCRFAPPGLKRCEHPCVNWSAYEPQPWTPKVGDVVDVDGWDCGVQPRRALGRGRVHYVGIDCCRHDSTRAIAVKMDDISYAPVYLVHVTPAMCRPIVQDVEELDKYTRGEVVPEPASVCPLCESSPCRCVPKEHCAAVVEVNGGFSYTMFAALKAENAELRKYKENWGLSCSKHGEQDHADCPKCTDELQQRHDEVVKAARRVVEAVDQMTLDYGNAQSRERVYAARIILRNVIESEAKA